MEDKENALVQFLKKEPPSGGYGKLEPHKEAILLLNSKGYSCAQIAKFLATVGVKTVGQNVRYFLKTKLIVDNNKIQGVQNGN